MVLVFWFEDVGVEVHWKTHSVLSWMALKAMMLLGFSGGCGLRGRGREFRFDEGADQH